MTIYIHTQKGVIEEQKWTVVSNMNISLNLKVQQSVTIIIWHQLQSFTSYEKLFLSTVVLVIQWWVTQNTSYKIYAATLVATLHIYLRVGIRYSAIKSVSVD